MRVLISSNPMFGHVNTLLPVASAARRAGHDVVFATGSSMTGRLESEGFETWSVGPAAAPSGADADWITYFLESAAARAGTLVPRATEWMPDIVIHDETELAAPVAAASVGARHVVHGLGLMPPLRIWDVFAAGLDRMLKTWDVETRAADMRDATYLDVCPPALQPPGERIWANVKPVRHSAGRPMSGQRLPAELELLPYARTVHLTLGTVFNDAVGVLRAAIEGLGELEANIVVTTGPDSEPADHGPQPPHVVIARYLPHALLLPRCDLVVSQGGAGVLLGALAHGLPQLVLPQGADQDINADACVHAGAGLMLGRGDVTPSAVAAAATRLLAEPEFAQAARVVKAEIEDMPDPDSVVAALTTAELAPASSAP
jgi:UDP:flavonoid glycosyltransferase YjiC (YdhE family)